MNDPRFLRMPTSRQHDLTSIGEMRNCLMQTTIGAEYSVRSMYWGSEVIPGSSYIAIFAGAIVGEKRTKSVSRTP